MTVGRNGISSDPKTRQVLYCPNAVLMNVQTNHVRSTPRIGTPSALAGMIVWSVQVTHTGENTDRSATEIHTAATPTASPTNGA